MKQRVNFSHMPFRLVIREIRHVPAHYHPDTLKLLLVLEGELVVDMGQCAIPVQAGDIVVVGAQKLHSLTAQAPCTAAAVYFDLTYYQDLLPFIQYVPLCSTQAAMSARQLEHYDELRNYLIRILLMHAINTPAAQGIMQQLFGKIILLLGQQFQSHKPMPEHSLERYYHIWAYLSQGYRGEISVTEIARIQKISVTRLAHFWKEATGKSIGQTITGLRLEEAERLLLESSQTISEIVTQCGFSDEKYFYQHFKAHFGATPKEYHIAHLENRAPMTQLQLTEQEARLRTDRYAIRFYRSIPAPTLPGLSREELEKEMVLNDLYSAILVNAHVLRRRFDTTQQREGYLQIAPDKALYLRDGRYHINWEYVYAQMHIFLDCGLTANLQIDFDCMDIEQWKTLLHTLIDEIKGIWGKSVVESQEYLVHSRAVPAYERCIALVEYLHSETPVKNAKAAFLL